VGEQLGRVVLDAQDVEAVEFLAADQRGFDKLIGSLRVTEELEQAGIDLARPDPKPEASRS